MKKLLLLLIVVLSVLLVSSVSQAALTKTVVAVDEWAAVPQNTVREGATVNLATYYYASVHIDMAVTSATVHIGTKVEIQVSSNTTGDEDWTTFYKFSGPTAAVAANPEALAGAEAAGQTVLEVASTTGRYDDDEARWIFILDDTVADSEMCLLVSHVGATSVTVQDGITNAHDASDTLYDVAMTYTYSIPVEYNRMRIIYDNTFDSDGSQVHCKARLSVVTALE